MQTATNRLMVTTQAKRCPFNSDSTNGNDFLGSPALVTTTATTSTGAKTAPSDESFNPKYTRWFRLLECVIDQRSVVVPM